MQKQKKSLPLFPTSVIGSLPRPQWVLDLVAAHAAGKLDEKYFQEQSDRAALFAIGLQEQAGLDIITDGEWRREGYFQVFIEKVGGFKDGLIPGRYRNWPAVVSKIKYTQPITCDALAFLRKHTKRKTKATIPSPYIIARRFYHPEHSTKGYKHRDDFLWACAEVLRKEARKIEETGADFIQVDDPLIGYFVDDKYRTQSSGHAGTTWFPHDVEKELRVAIEASNHVLGGVRKATTILHVCRGNWQRGSDAVGSYDRIWDHLCHSCAKQLALEFALPAAGGVDVLKNFPRDKQLGLGCVDVRSAEVEKPETIQARVEAALQHLPADRITLNPDCGFAPSSVSTIPLDEPYQKLKAECEAAKMLRSRHGAM